MPLSGILADRISPAILSPFAFTARAIVIFCFLKFVDDPDSWEATLTTVCMMCLSMLEAVVIMSMFYRTLPSDIRGAMIGLFSFFGQFG